MSYVHTGGARTLGLDCGGEDVIFIVPPPPPRVIPSVVGGGVARHAGTRVRGTAHGFVIT